MKIVLTILLLLFVDVAIAQQTNCIVSVKINGQASNKNVFLYVYDQDNLIKQAILGDINTFDTGYKFDLKSGYVQYARIILSDADSLSVSTVAGLKQGKSQKFILEPVLDIEYDVTADVFSIKGDSLNKTLELFYQNEFFYNKRQDSLFAEIDQSNIGDIAKKNKKALLKRQNYLEQTDIAIKLIKTNIQSIVSLDNFFVFTMVPIKPVNETRSVFNLFPAYLRNSKRGKLADSLITVQENMFKAGLKPGDSMPVFTLNDAKDKMTKSTDVYGKFTLIDFWASWCAPCRAESPNLRSAYQRYEKNGFRIISISIDQERDKQKWLDAIEKDATDSFINLFNPGATSGIAKDLGVNSIPANYLINSNGKVISVNLRGPELQKKLAKFFP